MHCVYLLSAVVLLLSPLVLATPLSDLIEEEIYEANKETFEKHLDFRDFEGFSYSADPFKFAVSEILAGNFSTVALVGQPDIKQEDGQDSTTYKFDLALGLKELEVKLRYSASLFFLTKSGVVVLNNNGNAIRITGEIHTYTSSSGKPCTAALDVVEVKTQGSIELTFKPSGVGNWFLTKIFNILYRHFQSYAVSAIDQQIVSIVKTSDFQKMFLETACKTFNF